VEAGATTLADALGRLALFADLGRPELEAVAHSFEEEVFAEGQRVIRQGLEGSGFYLILDGEARVAIDGEERARLGRGEFFGEISLLTGERPTADVVAVTVLRCLVVPGPQLKGFLLEHPSVMLRMLQAEAQRLRSANMWAG
jgi:CRP-like cAMP-binding protein